MRQRQRQWQWQWQEGKRKTGESTGDMGQEAEESEATGAQGIDSMGAPP